MIDGKGHVFDVRTTPGDITSFTRLATNTSTTLSNPALEINKNELLAIMAPFDTFDTNQNGLPDSSVNGTCSSPGEKVTLTFDTTGTRMGIDGTLETPLNFTVANVPNNVSNSINIRLYPISEDVTQGGYVGQFQASGISFDLNSSTSDIQNSVYKMTTIHNGDGTITRNFIISKLSIRGGSTIINGNSYVVAFRIVDGGSTGTNSLNFSTNGIQQTIGSGNSKNAVFKLNALTADNSLSTELIANDVSVNIYPNPTRDILYVSSKIITKKYILLDQLVRKLKEVEPSGSIDVSEFSSGIYYLLTDMGVARFYKQ